MSGYEQATKAQAAVEAAGDAAQQLGGILRCCSCGRRAALGRVADRLARGWPTCCGHTMEWLTDRQIEAGELG